MTSDDETMIVQRWLNRLPFVQNAPPVIYDNQPGEQPPLEGPWIRLAVRPSRLEQVAFPGPSVRRLLGSGRIEIQVYVPTATGTAELTRLVDAVIPIFRDWKVPRFRVGPIDVFTINESGYLARRVSIPYESTRYV
jgi:hypothetical protein